MLHLAPDVRQKLAPRVSARDACEVKNRAPEVRHILGEQGRKVTSYSFPACGREAEGFALLAPSWRRARRILMIAGKIERRITTAMT